MHLFVLPVHIVTMDLEGIRRINGDMDILRRPICYVFDMKIF